MKYSSVFALCALMLCIAYVNADCEEQKDSDDGEVKAWFKTLGCKIQKGAGDLGEQAKPWADKIGATAKDFGNTVAKTYDDIKHKLTDDKTSEAVTVAESTSSVQHTPLEKVPLAPLNGENAAAPAPAPTHVTA